MLKHLESVTLLFFKGRFKPDPKDKDKEKWLITLCPKIKQYVVIAFW